jgi:hypothetical protein
MRKHELHKKEKKKGSELRFAGWVSSFCYISVIIGVYLLFIVQLITGKENKEVTMIWLSILPNANYNI